MRRASGGETVRPAGAPPHYPIPIPQAPSLYQSAGASASSTTGGGGEGNVGDKKRILSGVTRETDSLAGGEDHTSSSVLGVCVRNVFEGEGCDAPFGERLLDAERGFPDGFRRTWSRTFRSPLRDIRSDSSATSLIFSFPFVDGLVGEGRSTPPSSSSPLAGEAFCGLEVFRGVNSTYAVCFGVRPLGRRSRRGLMLNSCGCSFRGARYGTRRIIMGTVFVPFNSAG